MRCLWLLVGVMVVVCGIVSATPTTLPATAIGNNNVTMNGNGVSGGGTGWFQFGMKSGYVYAHTKNVTANGSGTITYTMRGTPLFGCTTYYYKACDATGCGNEASFVILQVTPLPTVTFGSFIENVTENQFDVSNLIWNSVQMYVPPDTGSAGVTIFVSLFLSMIFVGIWLRTRGTIVATALGVICIGLFISSATALQWGMAPEFVAAAQALLYVSFAGIIVSFTFK
jgi:hypothetical protein